MKKFLSLSLILSMAFFMSSAQAGEITIGKKSYPNSVAVGIKTDDYYSIVIGDATSVQDVTTAFVFYIPTAIFANGTYDLVSLTQNVNSVDDAVGQCEDGDEEDSETEAITLPDSSKVYLVGSSTKIKQKGKFFTGKGLSIADKSFKDAQVTISGIGTADTSPFAENVTITLDETKLPVFKVNYKVFQSEDCAQVAKKSKFKASKKAKKAKISVDVTALVVTGSLPSGF